MARKVHVVFEDDIDGSPASETISFAIDGKTFEIDLSAENAAALRKSLSAWIDKARLADGGRARKAPAGKAAGVKRSSSEIREWAKANGVKVSERGRISADVLAKFEAANS